MKYPECQTCLFRGADEGICDVCYDADEYVHDEDADPGDEGCDPVKVWLLAPVCA